MTDSNDTFSQVSYVEIEDRAGQRIDNFLITHLKGVPKSRIYRMIRTGEVRINGSRCKASNKLAEGDKVRIPPVRVIEPKQFTPSTQLIDMLRDRVVSQSEDIYVLDKPSGLAVHGGSGEPFGLAEILVQVFEGETLNLVHRLDKDTSGCLVIARNRNAMLRLNGLFRGDQIHKRYDLIVAGGWPKTLTKVNVPLARYTMPNGERRVQVEEDGQDSETYFTIKKPTDMATWLEAKPVTGRTHQIRVHAQNAGYPILGDSKYGDTTFKPKAPRMMLHATQLAIPEVGEFEAPVPSEFEEYWRAICAKLED